jgi:hypothetical protein
MQLEAVTMRILFFYLIKRKSSHIRAVISSRTLLIDRISRWSDTVYG